MRSFLDAGIKPSIQKLAARMRARKTSIKLQIQPAASLNNRTTEKNLHKDKQYRRAAPAPPPDNVRGMYSLYRNYGFLMAICELTDKIRCPFPSQIPTLIKVIDVSCSVPKNGI